MHDISFSEEGHTSANSCKRLKSRCAANHRTKLLLWAAIATAISPQKLPPKRPSWLLGVLPGLPLPAAAPPLPPSGPARFGSRAAPPLLLPPAALLHAVAAGRAPLPPCQLPATALLPAAVVGCRLPVALRGAWQWLPMPKPLLWPLPPLLGAPKLLL